MRFGILLGSWGVLVWIGFGFARECGYEYRVGLSRLRSLDMDPMVYLTVLVDL